MISYKAILKQAVQAAGSQRALAKWVGVHERTIRRWVAGDFPQYGLATDHVDRLRAIVALRGQLS